MSSKLVRSTNNMFLGVAAGIANYTNIDVTIIRLLFILFTLAGGPGLIAYLILAVLMPREDALSADEIVINS